MCIRVGHDIGTTFMNTDAGTNDVGHTRLKQVETALAALEKIAANPPVEKAPKSSRGRKSMGPEERAGSVQAAKGLLR